MAPSELRWNAFSLPTDRAVISVGRAGTTRWALASNTTEREQASPGSVLLTQQADGAWRVHTFFEDLALRSLCCFPDGQVMACGMAGAAVRFDGVSWKRCPIPGRPTVHRVWGPRAGELHAVGDNLWASFDGEGWRVEDLRPLLGADETPTLLDVHGDGENLWVVGSRLHEAGVLHRSPAGVRWRSLPSFYLYAVRAVENGMAVVLGNDGAWLLDGAAESRVVDLRGQPARPFGPPAFIARPKGPLLMGTIDGVGVLKALLVEQERLESSAFHLWVDGAHRHCRLETEKGITYLGVDDGVLVVGLAGELWESPLPR